MSNSVWKCSTIDISSVNLLWSYARFILIHFICWNYFIDIEFSFPDKFHLFLFFKFITHELFREKLSEIEWVLLKNECLRSENFIFTL